MRGSVPRLQHCFLIEEVLLGSGSLCLLLRSFVRGLPGSKEWGEIKMGDGCGHTSKPRRVKRSLVFVNKTMVPPQV